MTRVSFFFLLLWVRGGEGALILQRTVSVSPVCSKLLNPLVFDSHKKIEGGKREGLEREKEGERQTDRQTSRQTD